MTTDPKFGIPVPTTSDPGFGIDVPNSGNIDSGFFAPLNDRMEAMTHPASLSPEMQAFLKGVTRTATNADKFAQEIILTAPDGYPWAAMLERIEGNAGEPAQATYRPLRRLC